MSGKWLEADSKATNADPQAAAKVLKAIAETLAEAPPEKRYDIEIVVEERDNGEGDGLCNEEAGNQ